MEIDDLKRVWNNMNREAGQTVYSADEIAKFRKARSRDFSVWIQNGLILDIVLKSFFALAFLILIFLFINTPVFIAVASAIIVLCILLIIIESRYLRNSREADKENKSVVDGIKAKLSFLKSYYYRIQFLQGLTNPLFVAAGISFYYYFKYGQIRIVDFQDAFVISLLLIISFLFTLPTTFSLYGYHYRVLQAGLASLEDEDSWQETMKRYQRQKKLLYWLLGILLGAGITILALLIFL
jgi:hypothetical protein